MNIESLREYCLSFPAATEAIKWEHHLNFYVGGKIFCISTLDADGRVCFKVADEDFDETCAGPASFLRRTWLGTSGFLWSITTV